MSNVAPWHLNGRSLIECGGGHDAVVDKYGFMSIPSKVCSKLLGDKHA